MSRGRPCSCSTARFVGSTDQHYKAFVGKFKKVSRQTLPIEHCGARYEKMPDGYRMVQSVFCAKMIPAKIGADRKDGDKLTKEEITSYRSILCGQLQLVWTWWLMFLTWPRM